jgi:excisionase family DNA binding protein
MTASGLSELSVRQLFARRRRLVVGVADPEAPCVLWCCTRGGGARARGVVAAVASCMVRTRISRPTAIVAAARSTCRQRRWRSSRSMWHCWRHKIPHPTTWAQDSELTVGQIADSLRVSNGTVYAWIETGKLSARREPGNRPLHPIRSPSRAELPPARRELRSPTHQTKIRAAGGAV